MNQSSESMRRRRGWLDADTLVQSLWITLAFTVASRVAGLMRGVTFARAMDRAELGAWALSSNAVQLLSFALVFGVPGGLSRYAERFVRTGRLVTLLRLGFAVPLVIATLVCLGGVLAAESSALLLFDDPSLVELAALTWLATLVFVGFNLVQGALQGLRVFRLLSCLQIGQSMAFAALGGLLLATWRRDAIAAVSAHLAVTAMVSAWAIWLLWRGASRVGASAESADVATTDWRCLFGYSLGAWVAGGLQELWRVLDRFLLLHVRSAPPTQVLSEIGSYHVAELLALPLCAGAVTLSILLLPHAASLWESSRPQDGGTLVELAIKLTSVVLTVGAIGLLTFEDLLLGVVLHDDGRAARHIFAPLLASASLSGICYVAATHLYCREKAWSVACIWGLALVANGVANLRLIPGFGLPGAIAATLASASVALAATLWTCGRHGLRLKSSTWVLASIPLLLVTPTPLAIASIAAIVALAPSSRWLLSADERTLWLRLWAWRRRQAGAGGGLQEAAA